MLSSFLKRNQTSFQIKRYASTVGIRREDKSRWERRSALTPNTVKKLIDETGTQVYVQPSTKRIFTDEAYEKVYVYLYSLFTRQLNYVVKRRELF